MTKQNSDRATGAHLSVVGHAMMQELLSTLRPSDIAGGFANRFLFFTVRRSKMLPILTQPDQKKLRALASRLMKSLQNARKVGEVTLDTESVELWIKIYRELDADSEDDDSTIAPFLSRAAPQILRMAMVLALAEGERTIKRPQLIAAQQLWTCVRQSVEYMVNMGTGSLTSDQKRLFEHLEARDYPVSCTDVKDALKWNGTRFALVKTQLIRMHLIVEEKEKGSGGRPKQMLTVA
jgi:hypothetical protein